MKQLLLAATTVALLLTYAAAMSPATVFTAPTECTGLTATPTPFAAPYPTSFYIDTGSNGQVIFVQATGDAITVAGDCSLEYDAERKRSIVLAPSGCCEIGIPLASDLDVFVNGDARQVYLGALLLGAYLVLAAAHLSWENSPLELCALCISTQRMPHSALMALDPSRVKQRSTSLAIWWWMPMGMLVWGITTLRRGCVYARVVVEICAGSAVC